MLGADTGGLTRCGGGCWVLLLVVVEDTGSGLSWATGGAVFVAVSFMYT